MTEGFARNQTGFTRKQMTELVGEKVVLFPLREEDAPLIIRWRNTKRVRDHFIYRKPFTLQSQEAWFKDEIGSGRVLQFLMVEKASKKPIGSVYFRDIDPENRTAEYGIFIGEEEDTARRQRIWLSGLPLNRRSCAVCSFVFIVTMRLPSVPISMRGLRCAGRTDRYRVRTGRVRICT